MQVVETRTSSFIPKFSCIRSYTQIAVVVDPVGIVVVPPDGVSVADRPAAAAAAAERVVSSCSIVALTGDAVVDGGRDVPAAGRRTRVRVPQLLQERRGLTVGALPLLLVLVVLPRSR